MITKVILENFQKHEYLEIELDEQVTIICGPTDAGKSSIVRAIKWVALNRPAGDSFIRRGMEGSCKVYIGIRSHRSKGIGIARIRSNGINEYQQERKVYKAFGSAVPDEIARTLNLDEINFQAQMDAPLWFCQSAGEVSRELNQVVNLGDIDRVLSHLATETRKGRAAVEFSSDRLIKARQERDRLEHVPKLDSVLKELEAKSDSLSAIRAKIVSVTRSLESLVRLRTREKSVLKRKADTFKRMRELDSRHEKLSATHKTIDSLSNSLSEIKQLRERLTWLSNMQREAVESLQQVQQCPVCGNPITSVPS